MLFASAALNWSSTKIKTCWIIFNMLSVMQCFLFNWENYALSLISCNWNEGSRGEKKRGNIDCTVAVLHSCGGISRAFTCSLTCRAQSHTQCSGVTPLPTLCLIHPGWGLPSWHCCQPAPCSCSSPGCSQCARSWCLSALWENNFPSILGIKLVHVPVSGCGRWSCFHRQHVELLHFQPCWLPVCSDVHSVTCSKIWLFQCIPLLQNLSLK